MATTLIVAAALACESENPDAIDSAILQGVEDEEILKPYRQARFIPFDPIKKRSEASIKDDRGATFTVSKGAPQVIMDLCGLDHAVRVRAEQTVNEFAMKGYRTLGVARTDEQGRWVFLGLLPLFDPPRDDAAETMEQARRHGIDVKMVTGDNIAIARLPGRSRVNSAWDATSSWLTRS